MSVKAVKSEKLECGEYVEDAAMEEQLRRVRKSEDVLRVRTGLPVCEGRQSYPGWYRQLYCGQQYGYAFVSASGGIINCVPGF